MLGVMLLATFIIPLKVNSRVLSLIIALVYAIIGGTVYLIYTYKTKTLENVFGEELFNKIKKKIKK